ncbi:MAG: hypothetical protein LBI77_03395 [Puniceicoccales bacterium]|jgi:phosphoglucosamine mutase|nr:hypothetical protein [Puniceicoccales bacterium]
MKYFGTDGIRGEWGIFPANGFCFNILAQALERFHGGLKRVVIGRDPRISGKKIRDFLISGFSDAVEIVDAGILTSPLLSRSVGETQSDFGLMITASHNPAKDNGVKIFDRLGSKLSQENEAKIESLMDEMVNVVQNEGHRMVHHRMGVHRAIEAEIFKTFPKVVIDCANGAAVEFAKKAYHFPEIEWLGVSPDGYNINANCGSEHPELLIKKVRDSKGNLGIAHDGDGDRLLLCDGHGNILAGEVILGIIAIDLHRVGRLKENKMVTTQMSNRGLEAALEKRGIGVDYADVGDRNVAARMCELGCNFGGETSGHIIFRDEAPTSDGIQTALLFLRAMDNLKISLGEAIDRIPLFPKKFCNVAVNNKIPLEQLPDVQNTIAELEHFLSSKGKILVRYSGTENKLRLLVEAETEFLADEMMGKLKNSIENCTKII